MPFDSPANFALILVGALALAVLRSQTQRRQSTSVAGPVLRELAMLALSVIVLLGWVREHTLIVMGLLSLLVYVAGRAVQNGRKVWKTLAIAGLVVLFAFRNYAWLRSMLGPLEGPFLSVQRVGISYILFRMVHWLVESGKGQIPSARPLTFLNYIFFFPTFLAGPIDTYRNFQHGLMRPVRPKFEWAWAMEGMARVTLGGVKTLLVVPILRPWAMDQAAVTADWSATFGTPIASSGAVALHLLAYSGYILFDFSGYSDIAIGVGRWLGIRTPENFRNPYMARNLSDFWRRWHMTFSGFLKAYVFLPVVRGFNRIGWLRPHRLTVTVLAYLVTFVLCGLWHGDAMHFAVWGLWHGAGLSLNKLWTARWRPPSAEGPVYRWASTALTFAFVTAGWWWFHHPLAALKF